MPARPPEEPPPAVLHFTGSAPDAAAPAPDGRVSAVNLAVPARPVSAPPAAPATLPPAETVVAAPPAPAPAVPPGETSTEAAAGPDSVQTPAVRRRNPVVRLFQKVFHQHPKETETETPVGVAGKQP